MIIKERIELKVATTSLDGSPAANSAVSDAVELKHYDMGFSVNAYVDSQTGQDPTIDILVANQDDTDAFEVLKTYNSVDLPCVISEFLVPYKYFKVRYNPGGDTTGTKRFATYLLKDER